MVMQDQTEQSKAKTGWKSKVWAGIALLILAVSVVTFGVMFSKVPKAEWRNAYSPQPWEAAGICIHEIDAIWKSSAGDPRMELRAYCFPICRFQLKEATGEGQVTVRFINSKGEQMGDRLYIAYKDGKFTPRESNSLHVTETEVTVRLEDGFLSKDDYTLHQLSQDEPLWKVQVGCRLSNGEQHELGYISILPNDL